MAFRVQICFRDGGLHGVRLHVTMSLDSAVCYDSLVETIPLVVFVAYLDLIVSSFIIGVLLL